MTLWAFMRGGQYFFSHLVVRNTLQNKITSVNNISISAVNKKIDLFLWMKKIRPFHYHTVVISAISLPGETLYLCNRHGGRIDVGTGDIQVRLG